MKVDVEYCDKCNFSWQCEMLKSFLVQNKAGLEVQCHPGRRGAFEVKVDDSLIHSKLQCLAFPDHQSVLENVERVEQGLPVQRAKEQPIENCCIM